MRFLSLNHSATERLSDMEVAALRQYQKYIISTLVGEISLSLGVGKNPVVVFLTVPETPL